MPMFDKNVLGRKAQELGFVRDAYEKMSRLTEILQYINTEQELNLLLALKGGTAINLAVFNLPRLSVDIDLDFTQIASREETREKRERINEILGRYMAAEGYAQRERSKQTHALDSFVYAYTNAAGNLDNIKLEINYSLRCHVLSTKMLQSQAADTFSQFPIRTLAPVEIFASKIVALSSRAAARDLFDLNNMIYYGLFDESELVLLRKCAVLYFAIAGDRRTKGINFSKLDDITARSIKIELAPMIRRAEHFDFMDAKQRVAGFLNELMQLTEKEATFLECFATGKYMPELMFDDTDILTRIRQHPMAVWRIQRIRQERGIDGMER